MHQVDTFYNSLSYADQDSLNSATGGNFLTKSPTDGLTIIENKAKVRHTRNAVVSRVSSNTQASNVSNNSKFEIEQLTATFEDRMKIQENSINEKFSRIEKMLMLANTPAPVKAVEVKCENCCEPHHVSVCPIRGGNDYSGYYDNFRLFQQNSGCTFLPLNPGNRPVDYLLTSINTRT